MPFLLDRAHRRSHHPVRLTWQWRLCLRQFDSSSISTHLLLIPPSHPLAFPWERDEILWRNVLSFRSESILLLDLAFAACWSCFCLATMTRLVVTPVVRFAKLAASVEVIISWISSRLLLPEWSKGVVVKSKWSCNKTKITASMMQSQMFPCSVTADWSCYTRCFILTKLGFFFVS